MNSTQTPNGDAAPSPALARFREMMLSEGSDEDRVARRLSEMAPILDRLAHPQEAGAFLDTVAKRTASAPITCPAELYRRYTDTEAAKGYTRFARAIGSLLQTAETATLLSMTGNEPGGMPSNIRLGLAMDRHDMRVDVDDLDLTAVPDASAVVTCDLTGTQFVVPVNTAIPMLVFDVRDEEGNFQYEEHLKVHPALYVSGPEYVIEALWDKVVRYTFDAFEALRTAFEMLVVADGLTPADLGTLPAAWAFSLPPDRGAGGPYSGGSHPPDGVDEAGYPKGTEHVVYSKPQKRQ